MKTVKTDFFDSILLDEMEQVKLMNRTDTKYWFHVNRLQELLQIIQNNYLLLKIDGHSQMSYATTYYDTFENKMYGNHHNSKLNRYKVRRRLYVDSGIGFLEVKFKSNKGRTIKKRIPAGFDNTTFTPEENDFLSLNIPYESRDLIPTLINNFARLTLVNKNFKERCTIDLNLEFENSVRQISLNDLVIVEIKSEGSSSYSPLARALRDQRIKISGFSKYCVGRTITDCGLKRNAFKHKIRSIEKVIQSENNLYKIN